MNLLISNMKLQIENQSILDGLNSHESTEIILDAVQRFESPIFSSDLLAKAFFKNEHTISTKAQNGTIETPQAIAKFIVSLGYRRWLSRNDKTFRLNNDLHWFDPCCGAGVFPCAIINYYITELKAKTISDFPFITLTELSPLGMTLTLCSIKFELEKNGFNFSEYIQNNRLKILIGDSLSFFPEHRDFFDHKIFFDIVVGNPPYVRASRIEAVYKKKLYSLFPGLYNGNADLYTYFIASGLVNLEQNGVLAFISPAAFTRAQNGKTLREWLRGNFEVDTYIDLDETKIFKDADLHSAIYVLAKNTQQATIVNYLHIDSLNSLEKMCNDDLMTHPAVFEKPQGHGWAFHISENSLENFSKLFAQCTNLDKMGVNIYSGIRTGLSQAYIIDSDTYDTFSPESKTKWFKPIILPANIKRWYGAKKFNFMLTIPFGTQSIPNDILQYLLHYKEKLLSRPEVKNPDQWFSLRTCTYYSKMDVKKIAFPDLSSQQRFSIVDEGIYIPDGAYFIDSENLVLLGILNSSLAHEYFVKRCSSVGSLSSKGRFRFKKTFIKDFPVPPTFMDEGEIQMDIKQLVLKLTKETETKADMTELDQLVYQLYQEIK